MTHIHGFGGGGSLFIKGFIDNNLKKTIMIIFKKNNTSAELLEMCRFNVYIYLKTIIVIQLYSEIMIVKLLWCPKDS